MKKIRVLQFPIANSNGGITHYAVNNWCFMDKEKFSCDFATLSKHLDFESYINETGASVKYISCYAEENEEQFSDEVSKLLKNNYDIVHLHTNWWKSFLVEEIAKQCNISKIIVHSHNTRVGIENDNKRIEAENIHALRKKQFNESMATDFCACSNLAADWLFGPQIPRDKIKILKNAINVEKFLFNKNIREKYRHDLGLEDCFVIGNIGRLVYQKNQEFLINVFAEISKKNDKARLMLVGTGELEKDFRDLIENFGISDKVIFTGARNDVDCLLQAMDLFCLPSRFEGLPITAVEAQASGIECLVSDNITNEVCITSNIERLALEKELWKEKILESLKNYERNNMYDQITNLGYNIKYQIKEVEKFYLD